MTRAFAISYSMRIIAQAEEDVVAQEQRVSLLLSTDQKIEIAETRLASLNQTLDSYWRTFALLSHQAHQG